MTIIRINKKYFFIPLILVIFEYSTYILPQITVSQSELMEIFKPGNYIKAIEGQSGMINVGNYNLPAEYNFTFIDTQNYISINNYNISEIPVLAMRYELETTTIGETKQNIVENPVFLSITDSVFFTGQVTVENEHRFIHYNPYELFAKFPLTYDPPRTNFSQWISVYDTTYNLSGQIQSSDYYNTIVDVWVDGYGILKLPGRDLECLRMQRAYSWFNYKEFFYITKEGVLLVVTNVPSTSPDTGYVYADYHILYSTKLVSIKGEKNIPLKFRLEQNYPNPFNPVTNIEFQLVKQGLVTLKVYNILGEEVSTLINKELNAGIHKYLWNASGIASGIYFYRIQSGNFSQVKKMVLIK